MNEGVIEGGEYAGDAENEFTWLYVSVLIILFVGFLNHHLLGPEDPERCSRWRHARPSSLEAL